MKQKRHSGPLGPHQPGQVVSVAQRYSVWSNYQAAVVAKLKTPENPNPAPPTYSPYSIEDLNDTEALFVWQPAGQGYVTDCRINYAWLDKKKATGLWVSYDARIFGRRYKGVENPDDSLPGEYDEASGTRRAVFKDTQTELRDEYDGYIINPPYPRYRVGKSFGIGREISTLAVGVAFAVAAGAVVWALGRRQHK
ncbi:hypothetical protein [Hymenobacter convexus]|uniref:hypothetical protein n=1 Tax=Hymenobacter sp. CA1UV-4 TaxID=3063782 RepID=UPI002712D53F|nr:hypothetical protein [Hymenobacter sp. CA1UV-4]MDO7850726.1 hypothetical protein [Hymenobacter sp. CA1UV-4]